MYIGTERFRDTHFFPELRKISFPKKEKTTRKQRTIYIYKVQMYTLKRIKTLFFFFSHFFFFFCGKRSFINGYFSFRFFCLSYKSFFFFMLQNMLSRISFTRYKLLWRNKLFWFLCFSIRLYLYTFFW